MDLLGRHALGEKCLVVERGRVLPGGTVRRLVRHAQRASHGYYYRRQHRSDAVPFYLATTYRVCISQDPRQTAP